MAGEELPPVVVELLGDISDLSDKLAEAKAELDAFRDDVAASNIGDQMFGDLGSGLDDALSDTNAGEGLGEDIGAQVSDELSESGAGDGLIAAMGPAGEAAGALAAEAFGESFVPGVQAAAEDAAAVLGDTIAAGAQAGGEQAAQHVRDALVLGAEEGSADSSVAFSTGLPQAIAGASAGVSDAAAEIGTAAGDALAAAAADAVTESAAGIGAAVSGVEASAVDAAHQAGAAAGDAILAGVRDVLADASLADVGEQLGQSLNEGIERAVDTGVVADLPERIAAPLRDEMPALGAEVARDLAEGAEDAIPQISQEVAEALELARRGFANAGDNLSDENYEVFHQALVAEARSAGADAGEALSDAMADEVEDDSARVAKAIKSRLSPSELRDLFSEVDLTQLPISDQAFDALFAELQASAREYASQAEAIGEQIGADVEKGVAKSVSDDGGESGSLLVKAIAGGLLVGAPLIAGAIGGGITLGIAAAGAAIVHGNAQIQADWHQLTSGMGREMADAAKPLVPAVEASIGDAQTAFRGFGGELDAIFKTVAPDVVEATNGIDSLAREALPGVADAVSRAQPLVSGFMGTLGGLGSGIGEFSRGITSDVGGTVDGIESLMSILNHTLGTVGTVLGDTASGIGRDLAIVQTPLNGLLNAIKAVSSPALDLGVAGGIIAAKWNPLGSILGGVGGQLQKLAPAAEEGAEEATGALAGMRSAAAGAGGALESAGAFLGGPWGIALTAAASAAAPLIEQLVQTTLGSQAVKLDMGSLEDAIRQSGSATSTATTQYIAMTDSTSSMSGALQRAGISASTFAEAVTGQSDALTQTRAEMGAYLQQAMNGQVGLGQWLNDNDKLESSLEEQTRQVHAAAQAQAQAHQAAIDAATSTRQLTGNVQSLAYQAQQATPAFQGVVIEVQRAGQASSLTANQLTQLDAAWSNLSGRLSVDDSINAFDQDLANMHGTSLDATAGLTGLSSQAVTNRQTINQAAEQIENYISTAEKAGTPISTVAGHVSQMTTQLENQMRQAHLSQGAITAYLTQIGLLPAVKKTNVEVATAAAENATKQIAKDLNALHNRTIAVNVVATGAKSLLQGLYAGTATGHLASGGPAQAGKSYWVGEHGPEIVTFGSDAVVTPNERVAGGFGSRNLAPVTPAPSAGPTVHLTINTGPSISTADDIQQAVMQGMGRLGIRNPATYQSVQASRGRG